MVTLGILVIILGKPVYATGSKKTLETNAGTVDWTTGGDVKNQILADSLTCWCCYLYYTTTVSYVSMRHNLVPKARQL